MLEFLAFRELPYSRPFLHGRHVFVNMLGVDLSLLLQFVLSNKQVSHLSMFWWVGLPKNSLISVGGPSFL